MRNRQKKIISLLLAMMMLFSVLPAGTITASAASFTIRSTAPTSSNGYYYSSKNPFYSAGLSGQCTWYAYGRAYEILEKKPNLCLNDAKDWYSYNKNGGYYKYGQTPKVGAIVCWANGTHGHVGVVEKVVSNTDVYISEANVDGGNWRYRHYNPTTWNSGFQGYIYLLDNVKPEPQPEPPVCSFTGSYFEAAHPHKEYQKCSCGKTKYTGATKAYQNCSTCMKLSWSYVQPVKAYTINTGKTTVYSSVNGTAKSNKIYDTDLCTISQIYDCGWCKVTFPLDSGGTETGYCKIGVFMKSGGFYLNTSKQITTYRRSDLKTSSGYAGSGDKIYILGTAGSAVQIAYPLTAGGWKVGWVAQSAIKATINYNANGGSGSMSSSSVQYNNSATLAANKFTKTGYTFSGWNVYRTSDKKWYTSNQGWKTASEISKNGYAKKLYGNQTKYTFNSSWFIYGKTNDTFTFYAVWTPNKLSVNYNANGGTITSDTYKLSNNIVYKKSNNEKLTQTWTYNSAKSNGLYNASTFGLTREGYTFKGWGTTAKGGTIFDQNDETLLPTSINSAIKNGNCSSTLYAIWSPKTYSIKFDANGGSGAPAAQTKTNGVALTLSSTRPTRAGYAFLGWSTSSTATTAAYQPGSSYTSNSNATLYAIWSKIGVVSNVQVSNLSATGATLTWNSVSGASGYQLQYVSNGAWKNFGDVTANSRTFSQLTSNRLYVMRVRAYKTVNGVKTYSESWSGPIAFTTYATVSRMSFSNINSKGATLNINKVQNAGGYALQYVSNGVWKDFGETTANSRVFSSLASGTKYTFRVRAYTVVNGQKVYSSNWSGAYSFTTSVK